jgi:trehalose 6-phosphate phosphatase
LAVNHPGLAAPATAEDILESAVGRLALLLDVDGTLLDIADRPDRVLVPIGLVDALAATERRLGGALALVTGREVEQVDRLFQPLKLRVAAVHGAELRLDPDAPPTPVPGTRELPPALWEAVTRALRDFPGTFAENKRFSITVHYRLAPGVKDALRKAVMRIVQAEPESAVEIMNARRAIELKSPGYNKGRAVSFLLGVPPFLGRTAFYIGDDTTDESAFAAVSAGGGYAFSVGRLRPGAQGLFATPGDVREWIGRLAWGRGA